MITNSNSLEFRQCWPGLALAVSLGVCVFYTQAQEIVYGTFPATSQTDFNPSFSLYDQQGYRLVSWEPTQCIYYNLCIGSTGQTHLVFRSGDGFVVTGNSSNDQVLAYQQGPLFSPWVVPLAAGAVISGDAGDYEWTSGDSVLSASRASDEEGNPILSIGYFTQTSSGYFGFRFQEDGQTHYGWIRAGAPFEGINGGWLYDYAYSTVADKPISAGQGRRQVVYVAGPSFGFPVNIYPVPLDLNEDAKPDLVFSGSWLFTTDYPSSGSWISCFVCGSNGAQLLKDNDGALVVLPYGQQIGMSTNWISDDMFVTGEWINNLTGTSSGWQGNLGKMGRGFLPVRLQASDGIHYGWVQIDVGSDLLEFPGVVDWAYESEPDVPAVAGVVPLVAVGASLIGTDAISLNWKPEYGVTCQVQTRKDVAIGHWLNIGDKTAVDAPISNMTLQTNSEPSAFFRVVQVRK